MALRDRFLNCGLSTGNNDGTSEANAWRTFADCESAVEAGDIVHCRTVDGNRVTSEANMTFDSPAVAPSVDKPIKFQGYTTTPGDGGMFKWGHFFFNREKFVMIEGFDIDQSSGSPSLRSDGDGFIAYRCHVVNESASFDGACRIDDGSAVNCYFRCDLDGAGKVVRLVRGNLIDSYVESPDDSTGGDCYVELNISFRMSSIINTIINGTNRAVKGVTVAFDSNCQGCLIMNNTIFNTSDAIEFENGVGTNLSQIIITQNNIIDTATNGILNTRATNTTSVIGHFINNNAMKSISSAEYTNIQDEYIRNKITLTADPFIDKVDFELNDAAGGGALCKFLGAGPRQYDPTLLGTTFANDRATGRRNFSSIGAVTPKGAETSHVF